MRKFVKATALLAVVLAFMAILSPRALVAGVKAAVNPGTVNDYIAAYLTSHGFLVGGLLDADTLDGVDSSGFVQAEADTLQTVLDRGATATTTGDVSVTTTGDVAFVASSTGPSLRLQNNDDWYITNGSFATAIAYDHLSKILQVGHEQYFYVQGDGTIGVFSVGEGDAGISASAVTRAAALTAGQASVTVSAIDTSTTFVGRVFTPDGTTAAPSVAFTSDTDTGLIAAAANAIGVVCSATEIARWTTSGLDMGADAILMGASIGSPDVGFARVKSGRVTVTRGTAGTYGGLVARSPIFRGQFGYAVARSSSVLDGDGLLANITETSPTTATLTGGSTGAFWSAISTTAANSDAGWFTTGMVTQADNLPYWVTRFRVEDVAEVRVCAFLSSSPTIATNQSADDPAVRCAGLQFSTGRPDTNFQWVEDDATTQTVTNTGVAPGVGTEYWLEVSVDALNLIVLTLSDAAGTVLSTRTVTSSPFLSSTLVYPGCAIRNLGSTDTKAVSTFVTTIGTRVGTP